MTDLLARNVSFLVYAAGLAAVLAGAGAVYRQFSGRSCGRTCWIMPKPWRL